MELKRIGKTEVVDCINLMKAATIDNEYHGYYYDEINWCTYFMNAVKKQNDGDVNYIAHGVYKDGHLLGFMVASAFTNYYNNNPVMDVKDMIVDEDAGTFTKAKVTAMLFDNMIAYTKSQGGTQWRADSIRTEEQGHAYAKFLQKRYGCAIHTSARGIIE